MIETLIEFFENITPLTSEEKSTIRGELEIREVPRNTVLLNSGKVSTEFYFILKGCARLYYLAGIEEKTAFFYTENMFVSSYESFTRQIPAKHSIQVIEDSTLVVFNIESAQKLLEASPKFEMLARIMMEEEMSVYQDVISSFVTQNAEQRYESMLKEQPELLQRIPQHQIATFLGVTPETLSRIRKRIADR